MLDFTDPVMFWSMVALQLVGLASVVLARLRCQCPFKSTVCRVLFFGCLLGVAVATMFAIQAGSGSWAWSGTTFSLMAVGATLDMRGTMPATGF
jgi:hypothetical protein